MSSARRIAANRANGRKSQGPVTPEGKARSASNAPTPHGLASSDRAASSICLNNENRDEFLLLYDALVTEHTPVTTTEHLTTHEMAVARWRLQRAWAMETALLDNQMDHMMDEISETYESTDEATRAALALRKLSEASPSLDLVHRYETRLTRQFDRCLKRLAGLRVQRDKMILPTEPNPKNGQSVNDPELQQPSPAAAAQPAPGPATGCAVAPLESTPSMDVVPSVVPAYDAEPDAGAPPALPRAA
jgi:hypothetical protein